MDLQNAFYIIGIVFMGLMLVILIALIASVFIIRARIVAIHNMIESKLNLISGLGAKGSAVLKAIKKVSGKSR